ncbi:glycosyltransferase [Humibacter sp. RRB41]|uniref:glycosyltransferase n=1 Tax=Humibacter sp. RRB41 TaxID=2919946 RepID=UPI001FAAE096|nr:glycosyltransferase [Humibacter sp. RRB41]
MDNPSERRVVAVVSVYRPGHDVVDNVARIVDQVDHVVVVDDGSGDGFDEVFSELTAAGARLVVLQANSGIAAALNAGIEAADLDRSDVVVTFDQDSNPPAGFVARLLDVLRESEDAGLPVAIVAPATFAGVDQTGPELASGLREALRPIQSGMLVTGSALERIGTFDEGLFIDLVDVEFYLRALEAGLVSVAASGLDLPHELGHFQSMSVLGRRVSTTLSSPFRYYYRARNRVIVTRRYRNIAGPLLRRERNRDLAHFVVAVAFARPRPALVTVLRRGWRDGRTGAGGGIPSDLNDTASSISWRGQRVERPGHTA